MKKVTGKGFVKGFDWGLYPEAERFLNGIIRKFLRNHGLARHLAKEMYEHTSTKFFDWIDYVVLPKNSVSESTLRKLGFKKVSIPTHPTNKVYKHTQTVYFPLVLAEGDTIEIALKPEYLDHFIKKIHSKIEGKRFGAMRYARMKQEGRYILSAVERRGSRALQVVLSGDITPYQRALMIFAHRKRKFKTDVEGIAYTQKLVNKVLKTLSKARTADAFFRNERKYWETRNKAGQIQRKRQDLLGLGWGNHDHHTYRCSREHFVATVKLFESMGYICRERFYAGEKAGWGAQILEHPDCDIVLFVDTDLGKEEKNKDFAHKGLKDVKKLGTVGLWVGLHGQSILQAGMHHLEARFDFDKLRKDMPSFHVNVMQPFSYFQFLKQAFTVGEVWKVEKKRAQALLKQGSITQIHYDTFMKEGAIGSHLENLQRKQGYKGFNQESVSAILAAVDPRKQKIKGA